MSLLGQCHIPRFHHPKCGFQEASNLQELLKISPLCTNVFNQVNKDMQVDHSLQSVEIL